MDYKLPTPPLIQHYFRHHYADRWFRIHSSPESQHNALLKELADGQLRAFFVSIKHQLIVAPYDGGIDFILKDSQLRDTYQAKYQDWLSKFPGSL